MKRVLAGILFLLCLAPLAGGGAPGREVRATLDPDGVQRATIVGGSYFFDPERVVVKVNVPVELTVRKEGGIVPHNFVIKVPEAAIDVKVPLETTPKRVTFTPGKTGKFPYYCTKRLLLMESHREKGMAGILEVVE